MNNANSSYVNSQGNALSINCTPNKKQPANTKTIPDEFLHWALSQPPTVFRLFVECWLSDGYGNLLGNGERQYKNLSTTLKGENFRKTKKVLEDAGFFKFEKITRDGVAIWRVWNCQGLISGNWKTGSNKKEKDNITKCSIDVVLPTESGKIPTENWDNPTNNCDFPTESGNLFSETLTQQAFQLSQESTKGNREEKNKKSKEKEIKNKLTEQQPTLNATVAHDGLKEEQECIYTLNSWYFSDDDVVLLANGKMISMQDTESLDHYNRWLRNQSTVNRITEFPSTEELLSRIEFKAIKDAGYENIFAVHLRELVEASSTLKLNADIVNQAYQSDLDLSKSLTKLTKIDCVALLNILFGILFTQCDSYTYSINTEVILCF